MTMQSEPDHPDLRVEPRVVTFEAAKITSGPERFARHCVLADISARGARLSLVGIDAVPDEFDLSVPRRKLWTRARVVWRRPSSCGVAFLRGSRMPTV